MAQRLAANRRLQAGNAPRCKLLMLLLSDRAAPRAFYLARGRSAFCSSPFLRGPSPNCDQTKTQPKHSRSRFRAGSLQSTRRIFRDRTCVKCRQIERSQDAGAAAAVPFVCKSDAGRRQADGSRSNVVMSGVVDSREVGHGNIDANDPKRTSRLGTKGLYIEPGSPWRNAYSESFNGKLL